MGIGDQKEQAAESQAWCPAKPNLRKIVASSTIEYRHGDMASHSVGKDQTSNGAFLTSQRAHSDVGTGSVAFGFVGFERRVSVVISASQWDET